MIYKALLVAFLFCIFCGCGATPHDESPAGLILVGRHPLRKLITTQSATTTASGGFFLFVGSLQAQTTTEINVRFAWLNNDSEYVISTLPLDKLKVRIDNTIDTPIIEFRWRPSRCTDNASIMELCVISARITCQDAMWPTSIEMPFNDGVPK